MSLSIRHTDSLPERGKGMADASVTTLGSKEWCPGIEREATSGV